MNGRQGLLQYFDSLLEYFEKDNLPLVQHCSMHTCHFYTAIGMEQASYDIKRFLSRRKPPGNSTSIFISSHILKQFLVMPWPSLDGYIINQDLTVPFYHSFQVLNESGLYPSILREKNNGILVWPELMGVKERLKEGYFASTAFSMHTGEPHVNLIRKAIFRDCEKFFGKKGGGCHNVLLSSVSDLHISPEFECCSIR